MSTISASTTTTTAYKVTADTTGKLVLQTGSSPTTALTLRSDTQGINLGGDVVTPTPWQSTFRVYDINNGQGSLAAFNNADTFLMSQLYYDGAWKFTTTGKSGSLLDFFSDANGGAIEVRVATTAASSVTAGGAVTYAYPLTVNQYGISLGNTSGNANASSGTGIRFPGTQNASSDPNTLDDYEEGTWTPTWGASGFTASGASFSNARYIKIGKQVLVEFAITISGTSGNYAAGDGFNISGMPFTNANVCAAGTCWASSSWIAGSRATGNLMAYTTNDCYVGIEYASGVLRSQSLQCAVVYQIA